MPMGNAESLLLVERVAVLGLLEWSTDNPEFLVVTAL